MTKKFAKQSTLILDYGKNGKTLKKFPDRGELKKKKPSERKPIITNDPKDPRLRAYNDSLNLYNQAKIKEKKFMQYATIDNLETKQEVGSNFLPTVHPNIAPIGRTGFLWEKTSGNVKHGAFGNSKAITENAQQFLDSNKYPRGFAEIYKKPVQPVVYKKPENPSDKDLNDNNKYRELKGKEYEEYAKRNPLKKGEVRKRMWVPIETQIDKNPQKIEMMQQDVAENDYSGYDITPTENKKVIPKPTQDKTDFYIQSLDKDGKQKVKYFNSKKEKDDYDNKLSKDFYFTSKTDNSTQYTAILPEMENGGTMNKLGVENSLWNNIRAKAGSGKKPTKEMLKQEKKIKRKAPDGITLDGEYPFVGNLKKMYENAVQGQQQQVQQIGAKVGQQAADTLMPITPVNNVQKNKPNQNQYNDFNAYQQDLTDWEKENNQRSDYKGDTVEKDGIAVVQMTDKELKNPSKQQWGNHLAKPTPPKNERKRGNYAPYFLGGLAAADLLLPDVNRERQQDFNRPEDEPYYNPYPNGLGSGALAKNGKTLKQYPDEGDLKPINQGKPVSSQDSLRHQAGKMMDFEARKGSPTGTGLSNWGYHQSQLHVSNVPPNWKAPQTKEEAVNLYMKEIAPKLKYFPSAMEKGEAGDFTYNTGRDARVYMLDQFIKSKGDKNGLPNRGSYNKDIKTNDWTPELQKSLDEQWDKYSPEINKLPENQRRILLNKGRDFYYQNINKKPDGSPNDSYEATWKPRIWESVNTYEDGGNIQTNGEDLQLLSDDTDIEQISPSFHKFKDGKHGVKNEDGSEGVPIAYNGQTVEAQAPETFAVKSDGSGVIFSDKTKNPFTGKSFKSHTEELAKFENKHVLKPLKKVETLADNIDEQDPFDKLKANTVIAKQMGIKKAQQFVQMKTDELGQIQQNILDISEQTGMKPNEVSKQMKTAKYGMTIPKADDGITTKKLASETQAEYEKRKRGNKEYEKKSKFSEGVKEVGIEKVGNKTYKYGEKEGVAPKSNLKIRPGGTNTDEELVRAYVKRGATYEDVTTKKDGVGYAIGKNDPKLKSLWDKYKGKYAQGTNPQYEYLEQEDPEPIIPPPPILPPKTPPGTPPPEIPPRKIPGMTFDTEEQITPIEYGKVRNGNWKNYVGPAFGVLDRVNNRSDQGYNPRLKDVGEFQNRKLAQINSQGRAFQQGATSTGASVAELATGMGGFAEQAANSEAEIQAFNQGNKNMVYNENIGIVNDFAKFNSGINTINNERRLMAEEFTKQNNVKALNTIGKYSAMEDRDRNAFVVNQGYYPTYGHDKNTLQPNVRPNQNPFDNDAMFQVGGNSSKPATKKVKVGGNSSKPATKKVKYGMSLVKEFKRYKP